MSTFSLYRYQLPLIQRLVLNQSGKAFSLDQREGLLLQLTDQGQSHWSECAPLMGFSQNSLENCQRWLTQPAHINDFFNQRLSQEKPDQAVMFALQSLRYKKAQPRNLADLHNVPVCQLWHPNSKLSTSACIKVKVGKASIDEDITTINALTEKLADHQTLRLDANQSWTMEQCQQLIKAINLRKIDFIEEPLLSSQKKHYQTLCQQVNIGLDESLLTNESYLTNYLTKAHTWVIKPMILGLDASLKKIEQAKSLGIGIVLSHLFESPMTIDFYRQLALEQGLEGVHGLDTSAFIKGEHDQKWLLENAEPVMQMTLQGALAYE